jgi:hypothetical protein
MFLFILAYLIAWRQLHHCVLQAAVRRSCISLQLQTAMTAVPQYLKVCSACAFGDSTTLQTLWLIYDSIMARPTWLLLQSKYTATYCWAI